MYLGGNRRLLKPIVNIKGYQYREDVGGHLSPDDAVHAEQVIEQEEQGDVEDCPADYG